MTKAKLFKKLADTNYIILDILVSILILMDLPFLLGRDVLHCAHDYSFNPYSNGSSFFISAKNPAKLVLPTFQSLF